MLTQNILLGAGGPDRNIADKWGAKLLAVKKGMSLRRKTFILEIYCAKSIFPCRRSFSWDQKKFWNPVCFRVSSFEHEFVSSCSDWVKGWKMAMYRGHYGFGVAQEKSEYAAKAARHFMFHDLCNYLDGHPKLGEKDFNDLLNRFYSVITFNPTDDVNFSAYPLVRMLIPNKDNRRRLTAVCLFV